MRTAIATLLALTASSAAAYMPIEHGIQLTMASKTVQLAVQGQSAFRFTVGKSQTDTPYLNNEHVSYADYNITRSNDGYVVGLQTSFGELSVNASSGSLVMKNGDGKTVLSSSSVFGNTQAALTKVAEPETDMCHNVMQGYDASGGVRIDGPDCCLGNVTQQACCDACNDNAACNYFVFATSNPGDGGTHWCWLMSSIGGPTPAGDRNLGGRNFPPEPTNLYFDRDPSSLSFGSGAGTGDAQTLIRTAGKEYVQNQETDVPYFWSTEGYGALAAGNIGQMQWQQINNGDQVQWTANDLYLMPAASVDEATAALFDLTGAPRVLPQWAYGFLASRWGWNNATYTNDTLVTFREGDFPISAMISDFGWYTPEPDYNLPPQGSPTFEDFSYNNITYPDPKVQYAYWHDELNINWMGIRKPRLGNSQLLQMAAANGWLLDPNDRNLNYTIDDVRTWYAQQQYHYLPDGVDAFWNDEGETALFTFYYWNEAERLTLSNFNAKSGERKRFFSINRAFTLGMSRQGLSLWTGDSSATYNDLQNTPGYVLNWGLSGIVHTTCDIGGFHNPTTPLLLTRWYFQGVFLPVMRVHSTEEVTPHWPWLFGPEAEAAMRQALNMRYQLIPALYSLAHKARRDGTLIMRPLIADYLADSNVHDMTSQWLFGDSVMPAPVMNQDNSTSVYFPQGSGTWLEFNGTATHNAGETYQMNDVPLDHIPVFCKQGAVLPLAPVVQSTYEYPAGPLQIQVYAGADGSFDLIEDDGVTIDYEKNAGSQAIRTTTFTWDDASSTLSWTVSGDYAGDNIFTSVFLNVFRAGASGASTSETTSLGTSGSLSA